MPRFRLRVDRGGLDALDLIKVNHIEKIIVDALRDKKPDRLYLGMSLLDDFAIGHPRDSPIRESAMKDLATLCRMDADIEAELRASLNVSSSVFVMGVEAEFGLFRELRDCYSMRRFGRELLDIERLRFEAEG